MCIRPMKMEPPAAHPGSQPVRDPKSGTVHPKTQLGRFNGERIVPLAHKKKKPYGVTPRNVGQQFLQEALMTARRRRL